MLCDVVVTSAVAEAEPEATAVGVGRWREGGTVAEAMVDEGAIIKPAVSSERFTDRASHSERQALIDR